MGEDLADLGDALQRFFARRVRTRADAEDLAQETLVRAIARWGQLRRPEARRAWLFSIAHNLLRDERRRFGRAAAAADPPGIAPAPAWRRAIREAVGQGLGALPGAQREVILLRLLGDLSFGDIGRRLGIPEATARTRAFHGLRRLRNAVAARLRQEGLLVECAVVRERMLRLAFGLAADRVGEEVRRHLAACAECRQEADLLAALSAGLSAAAGPHLVVGGWSLHDLDGNATMYAAAAEVNAAGATLGEYSTHTSAPGGWTLYDGAGRVLPEVRRRQVSARLWEVAFRLHAPWGPGEPLRLVVAAPVRWEARREDGAAVLSWSEAALGRDAAAVEEVLCRRALQLPPGCRAANCDPAPDRRTAAGGLLTWSSVLRRGQQLHLRVTCTPPT